METSKSSSTMAAYGGEHLLRVVGHSEITGDHAFVTSETFRVGGHDWAVKYYPNGPVDGEFASVYLTLMSACEGEITACFSATLQEEEKSRCCFTVELSPSSTEQQKTWGVGRFVSKADLGCLLQDDDCLVIKCTMDVSRLINDDDAGEEKHDVVDSIVVVPPSNLSQDLGGMLGSGGQLKEDLTFNVVAGSGSTSSFKAHACLLRARLPLLHAKLLCDDDDSGGVMETTTVVGVEDMDADVLEVLLHYAYHDCLPGFMEERTEKATSMAQRLLAVADRYEVQRLKLMCERQLSKVVGVTTVCNVLILARLHNGQQLKDFCLKYIATDRERLELIRGTEGFNKLKREYPLVDGDILDQFIARLPQQKKKLKASGTDLAEN